MAKTMFLVDTMVITKDTVMTIWIDAGEVFDVTGHYPILAGYDPSTGEALYIAVQNVDAYDAKFPIFTCVKNGASDRKFHIQERRNGNRHLLLRNSFASQPS